MSNDENEPLDYFYRPIYLGRPHERQTPLKATVCPITGDITLTPKLDRRPSKKTPYKLAYERRHGFYHRLVILPKIRRAAGDQLRSLIDAIASDLQAKTPPFKLTYEVTMELWRRTGKARDERVVRRALRQLGYRR